MDSSLRSSSNEKKLRGDHLNIIKKQNEALKKITTKRRRFYKERVLIDTIDGEPISVMMTVSDEDYTPVKEKIQLFSCEICGKEFDKKLKVQQHARFHKNKT